MRRLPVGALTMAPWAAMRFLKDYPEEDRYFRMACPEHNQVFAHAQMILVADMKKNETK